MGRVKNLDEIKTMIRERVGKRNTFRHAKREDVESVLANLTSKDPELWAKEWSRVAKPYEEAGVKLEQAGKFKEAREAYVQAYAYYATGRYPTPHTPGKMACYRKSLEVYEKAGKYFEPPLERLDIPFGDKKIPIYVRVPQDGQKHAIVINFGGIDSFKAESYEYDEGLQKAGMASCSMDMPGVGECPIKASPSGGFGLHRRDRLLGERAPISMLNVSPSWAGASAATGPPRWPTSNPSACARRSSGAAACIIFFRKTGCASRPTPIVISWITTSRAAGSSASTALTS